MDSKFSLYDVLSIILPGIVALLLLGMLDSEFHFVYYIALHPWFKKDVVQAFLLVIGGLVTGSALHIITMRLIQKKRFAGITGVYTDTVVLFKQFADLQFTIPVMNTKCMEVYNKQYLEANGAATSVSNEFYSYIYYYLEVNENTRFPFTFQAFYFFYRNLFVLALIFMPVCIFTFVYKWVTTGFPLHVVIYLLLNLLAVFLCRYMAIWYRKQMVKKMFWAFYVAIASAK